MTLTHQERMQVLRTRAVTWAGIVATGVLFLVAMSWFPGEGDGRGKGYSFGGHFLSAMGRTRAGSFDNTVSCFIFNGTLIMVGTLLMAFWKSRALFFTRPAAATVLRHCGLAMGLAMAGIGLTPYNFFPHVHNLMTYAVILFGVVCFGLCFFGSWREFESMKSKLTWLAILMVAGAAQAVFWHLTSMGRIPSRPVLPLMQKLFVLLLALWAGWQGFLFGRACRTEPASLKTEDNGCVQA